MKRNMGLIFRGMLMALAVLVMIYSGIQLYAIEKHYAEEAKVRRENDAFKPSEPESQSEKSESEETVVNQGVIDLQAKNPEVNGWLKVPGTQVDYPFARGPDNAKYLRADLDLNYLFAGTIFMDFRCNKDFTGFNTILYGHNMKNGSMFGDLRKFSSQAFFDANRTAAVFLPHKNIDLEVFAYLVVNASDGQIYKTVFNNDSEKAAYLGYVKQNARRYRDVGLTTDDRIVTLSSCSYEFNDARMVVLARIIEN